MEGQSRDNWINQSMGTLAGLEEQQQDLEDELASTKDPRRRREIEARIDQLDKEIRQLYAAVESVVKGKQAAEADGGGDDDDDDDYAETAVFDRGDYTNMIQELLAEGSTAHGKAPRAAGEAKPASASTSAPSPAAPARAPAAPAPAARAAPPQPSSAASQSLSVSKVQMRALETSNRLKRNVTIGIAVAAAGFIVWIVWLAS